MILVKISLFQISIKLFFSCSSVKLNLTFTVWHETKTTLKTWILAHDENVIETLVSFYLTFLWHFQHGSKFKHLDYLISFYTKKSFSSLKWYLFHIRLSLNNEWIWLKHSKLAKTLIRDPFKFCSVYWDHLPSFYIFTDWLTHSIRCTYLVSKQERWFCRSFSVFVI